jgi:poly(3-hydroxybutyrate) depolymerase
VYPGFLQHTGFVAMNPDRHASSHYDYFKDLIKGDDASAEAHRKFYDEYNAVLDMDADYYLDTIRTVFQQFELVNGTWDVKNPEGQIERVRPQDIHTAALLTVEGELDDISGSGQTEAAHSLCTGVADAKREHYEVKGAGHYGIFSGRRWRELVYPKLVKFIAANDQPQRRAGARESLPAEDTIKPGRKVPAVAAKKTVATKKAVAVAPAKKPAAPKKPGARAAR